MININNIMNIPVNYSRLSHNPSEIILICLFGCSRNISYFDQCCSIFVGNSFHSFLKNINFRILRWIESKKKKQHVYCFYFYNNVKAFIVFGQFNTFLLNISINLVTRYFTKCYTCYMYLIITINSAYNYMQVTLNKAPILTLTVQ